MDDEVITGWHKSSYSNSSNCVEIAQTRSGKIAVRDSKDADGAVLTFSLNEWRGFVAKVQATPSHP